jgi:hypothetical protein
LAILALPSSYLPYETFDFCVSSLAMLLGTSA